MVPKRVLIVYSSRPPIIEYLKRPFERMGAKAEGFYADENTWFDRYVIHHVNKTAHNLRILPKGRDYFGAHPLSHLNYRSARLIEKVKEFSPDMVFLVRGIKFREDALREIRKGSLLFGWWIEKEERMEEALREIGLFDHYFFMNSSCVEEARRRGLDNASLLPHSVDASAFFPEAREKKYDWCFVGAWSPKRRAFIERALKVSRNAAIWGPRWIKKEFFNYTLRRVVKGGYIDGPDAVRLYNETRVVINITNWGFGEGGKRSGMNMRVLEVPACGAALLTDGSKDLGAVVTPGRHVILYDGINEFAEKLSYYIKNGPEREKIAAEGLRHVATNYTYDHVARIIAERFAGLKGAACGP